MHWLSILPKNIWPNITEIQRKKYYNCWQDKGLTLTKKKGRGLNIAEIEKSCWLKLNSHFTYISCLFLSFLFVERRWLWAIATKLSTATTSSFRQRSSCSILSVRHHHAYLLGPLPAMRFSRIHVQGVVGPEDMTKYDPNASLFPEPIFFFICGHSSWCAVPSCIMLLVAGHTFKLG